MQFQPLTKTPVELEHIGSCTQWRLPAGGTLTVGWGHSPYRTGGQRFGTGRLWARIDVPAVPDAGIDLPFTGWFHWTGPRGLRAAHDAVEQSGGFLGSMSILADYWEAAFRAERERAIELEDCVKRATEYLESDDANHDTTPTFPGGLIDGAYVEDVVEGPDDGSELVVDEPEDDWDPNGSW